MHSIDKNQSENNHKDLSAEEAVGKIKAIAEDAETCFFTTYPSSQESEGTRPMTVQEVDTHGALWFLSAKDSHTNADISTNPQVKLYFQESKRSGYLYLEGTARISEDRAKIKELWKPIFKTWFTEGEDDPRISILIVQPSSGYYWDNKHGDAIAGVKMLVGAATGKTLDDSIQGSIKV